MTKPHIPLDEIRSAVESCRKCPLAEGRTQTVFGVGNPSARVLIVGEAPGKTRICRASRSSVRRASTSTSSCPSRA